ncbi:hypothetical protein [Streptomyces fodineus]|nr:hypothetical protein [Streptomyces fodineus]
MSGEPVVSIGGLRIQPDLAVRLMERLSVVLDEPGKPVTEP